MTTYRLMDGASGRPGVGSSGTQPPGSPTAFSGNYIAGLLFQATGTVWMNGYYWWVPPGGDTGSVKCALWQQFGPSGAAQGTLVPGSVVTSGTLTAGQWNLISLSSPMLLAWPSPYIAALGYATTIGFPDTQHQFGTGNPYASGITNGPVTAAATSGNGPQQPFSTASADPSAVMPFTNDLDDLLWLDIQVTDTPPASAAYRLWPNRPYAAGDGTNGGVSVLTDGYTMSVQFSVSQTCALNKIWFYSATTAFSGDPAVALPTRTTLWDVTSQAAVSGSDNSSVSWKKPDGTAGSAGAGWLYSDYSGAGVILAASTNYKASVWYAGGSKWRTVLNPYWASGGAGSASGISSGPLTAPNSASSTPGQNSWHGPNLAWHYPDTFSNPENDWIDVDVTVITLFQGVATLPGAGSLTAAGGPAGAAALPGAGFLGDAATQQPGAALAAAGSLADVAVLRAGATLAGTGSLTATAGQHAQVIAGSSTGWSVTEPFLSGSSGVS